MKRFKLAPNTPIMIGMWLMLNDAGEVVLCTQTGVRIGWAAEELRGPWLTLAKNGAVRNFR